MKDVELYNGDCLEVMNNIPDGSVDMILCDLPYGLTCLNWDKVLPLDRIWQQYNRIITDTGAIALFGKEPFSSRLRLSNLDMFKYDWVWFKDTKSNFMQSHYQPLDNMEIISIFSKAYARNIKEKPMMTYNPQFTEGLAYKIPKESKTTDIFKKNHKNGTYTHYDRDTTKRFPYKSLYFNIDKPKVHPTQKPVALLEYLIKTYTNEGDFVLDNCMGSGSTGVACVNTKRKFIGIELDEKYFKVAEERIKHTQPPLF